MYFKHNRQREVPSLNTTSTADLSFMLLIFFLVTSSMDTDKGLARQLPPPDADTEELRDIMVKERNVMALELDADGRLTCDGTAITADELSQRVQHFVANAADAPDLPERSLREVHLLGRCYVSDRHIITVSVSPQASYDAYFQMQDAIVRGYNTLRNQLAVSRFGHSMDLCTNEERDVVAMVYPQRISEQTTATARQEGGEP